MVDSTGCLQFDLSMQTKFIAAVNRHWQLYDRDSNPTFVKVREMRSFAVPLYVNDWQWVQLLVQCTQHSQMTWIKSIANGFEHRGGVIFPAASWTQLITAWRLLRKKEKIHYIGLIPSAHLNLVNCNTKLLLHTSKKKKYFQFLV